MSETEIARKRSQILAILNSPENKRSIYELAMERSHEILSGECRVAKQKADPQNCPCSTCSGYL